MSVAVTHSLREECVMGKYRIWWFYGIDKVTHLSVASPVLVSSVFGAVPHEGCSSVSVAYFVTYLGCGVYKLVFNSG